MPILVEPDTTTAGVLTLGAARRRRRSSRVADEVDGWLNGRGEYAARDRPHPRHGRGHRAGRAGPRQRTPRPRVVLIRHELEPQVYAQAMQAGIGAVVAADDHAALGTRRRAAPRSTWEAIHGPAATAEGERDGQVFTVFSPKGGVGKTTMAVNLERRPGQARARDVCVVDLDLAFGDVAITMQLIPEHTIAEAAASEEDLDFSLLQTLLTRHESGLTILAAPTHPEGRDRISASLVRRVIQTLRRHFDFVVIDTPPGFDDQVLGAFDETDECIIVATLDVPTIKNTKVAIETLDLLNLVPGNRHLVLNRADEEVGLSPGNVEDILEHEGRRSRCPAPRPWPAPPTTGSPIVLSKPDHPVSKAHHRARPPARRRQPAAAKAAEPAKRGLFGRKK